MTSQPHSGRSSFNHVTGFTMSDHNTPRPSYDPISSPASGITGQAGREDGLPLQEPDGKQRGRPEASRSEPGFEVDEDDGGAFRGSPSSHSGSVRRSPERGASLGSLERGPGKFNGGGGGSATGSAVVVPRTRITGSGLAAGPEGRGLTRIVSGRTVEMPAIVGSVQELQAWSEAQPNREPPEESGEQATLSVLPDGSSDGGGGGGEDGASGGSRGGENSRDLNYYPVGCNGFGSVVDLARVDLARKQSSATELPVISAGSSGSFSARDLDAGSLPLRPLLLAFASRQDAGSSSLQQQQLAARAAAASAADPGASGSIRRVSAAGGQYDRSTNASVGGLAWQDIEALPFKDPVSGKEVSELGSRPAPLPPSTTLLLIHLLP